MADTETKTDSKPAAPVSASVAPAAPAAKVETPAPAAAPKPAAPSPRVAAPAKAPVDARKPAAKRKAKAVVAKPAKAPARAAAKAVKAPVTIIKAAKSAVINAAAKAASTAKKDVKTMATTFEAPKMLNDMNDRAKAAVEKSQKFAAEFGDFNKGNIEALVESGKIAAKGFESLGQDAADYTRKSFEGMTATLKSLATVKSPTDFFKLQGDYMRSAFDQAVAQSSKNTEAMIKLASDAAQPISNRFAVAVEKVKVAA